MDDYGSSESVEAQNSDNCGHSSGFLQGSSKGFKEIHRK
jgi:hypothetical protein